MIKISEYIEKSIHFPHVLAIILFLEFHLFFIVAILLSMYGDIRNHFKVWRKSNNMGFWFAMYILSNCSTLIQMLSATLNKLRRKKRKLLFKSIFSYLHLASRSNNVQVVSPCPEVNFTTFSFKYLFDFCHC